MKIHKFKKVKKCLMVGDHVKAFISTNLDGNRWIDHREFKLLVKNIEKTEIHFRIIDQPGSGRVTFSEELLKEMGLPKDQFYFIINPRKISYEK